MVAPSKEFAGRIFISRAANVDGAHKILSTEDILTRNSIVAVPSLPLGREAYSQRRSQVHLLGRHGFCIACGDFRTSYFKRWLAWTLAYIIHIDMTCHRAGKLPPSQFLEDLHCTD
jgi:hypothetical protein